MKGALVALHHRHQRLPPSSSRGCRIVGHRGATARPDRLRRLRAGAHVGHGELVAVAGETQRHVRTHAASRARDEGHPLGSLVHPPGSGADLEVGLGRDRRVGGAVSEASRFSSQQASTSHSTATGLPDLVRIAAACVSAFTCTPSAGMLDPVENPVPRNGHIAHDSRERVSTPFAPGPAMRTALGRRTSQPARLLSWAGHSHPVAAEREQRLALAGFDNLRGEDIRVTHELGGEHRRGTTVDLGRRVDLLHAAVVHHREPVGQGHRLALVVGHVDEGGAGLAVHAPQLDLHLEADLQVERRQRLVEQQHGGLVDERAGQ